MAPQFLSSMSDFQANIGHDRPSRLLVFGCGYLGIRVARAVVATGQKVLATTRNPEKAHSLAQLGIEPVIADWNDSRTLKCLPQADRLLVSVSYDPRSSLDRYESQVGGLARLLACVSPDINITYISTTGVYHQTDGSWVDETSVAKPTRAGGLVHLQAEAMLWKMRPQSRWTILRLAGIYGPGRIPRVADVRAARPIASAGGYLNLIHVDDAVRAVDASWDAPERLYLVADDQPVLRTEFYEEIARQIRAPRPSFEDPEPGSSRSFRSETNKRIWNRRMKRDLVPRLTFPTYREGLSDALCTR